MDNVQYFTFAFICRLKKKHYNILWLFDVEGKEGKLQSDSQLSSVCGLGRSSRMNLFVVVEPAVGQMDGRTIIFFSLRTLYSTQYQIQKVEVEIRKTTSIDSINSTLSLG